MKTKAVKNVFEKIKMNKKIAILLISALAIVLTCAVALCIFLCKDEPNNTVKKQYYVPNYEEDIFQNKAYMSYQRDLLYSVAGVEQLYQYERDFDVADKECQFFLSYFQCAINGEWEKYPEFFVEDYFEESVKFTMQMIYEPKVIYHSVSEETIDGQKVNLYNFHVEYKIFKNNETFREGVNSNTAVPQIYQLVKLESGAYKIYRILDVVQEK